MGYDKIPVSAVILCHNEVMNLERCIAALGRFTEVVVVDDGSTDGSQALAQSLGARVLHHAYESYAGQRNWAVSFGDLQCAWSFHLDADEVLSVEGVEEIGEKLKNLDRTHVGAVARKMILDGRWLRRCADYPVYVPRLLHKGGPRYIMKGHGEVIDAPKHSFVYLQEPMLHYVFSKGWDDWYSRHRKYAKDEAIRLVSGLPAVALRDLFARDRTARRAMLRTLSYRLPARPLQRFLYAYLFRRGFLDGQPGWDFCRAMVWYERRIDIEVRGLLAREGNV
jgi:glycosyltransferase involved in cell wall biosynthesis